MAVKKADALVRTADCLVTLSVQGGASTWFPGNDYFSGAMVLQMLREQLGDEAFFDVLRALRKRPAGPP